MNHLGFVKHAQEESTKAANKTFGIALETALLRPPKCAPVNVQSGQVTTVQKHLEDTKPVNSRPVEIRRRFSLAMGGAGLMIVMGYQLAQLRVPLNLTGQAALFAGLGGLAGSLLFYAQPSRQRLGAFIVFLSSVVGWIPFAIFLVRVIIGESLIGLYLLFLMLGPLLAMAGAIMVLRLDRLTPFVFPIRNAEA